jgi:hypothetical protein
VLKKLSNSVEARRDLQTSRNVQGKVDVGQKMKNELQACSPFRPPRDALERALPGQRLLSTKNLRRVESERGPGGTCTLLTATTSDDETSRI